MVCNPPTAAAAWLLPVPGRSPVVSCKQVNWLGTSACLQDGSMGLPPAGGAQAGLGHHNLLAGSVLVQGGTWSTIFIGMLAEPGMALLREVGGKECLDFRQCAIWQALCHLLGPCERLTLYEDPTLDERRETEEFSGGIDRASRFRTAKEFL